MNNRVKEALFATNVFLGIIVAALIFTGVLVLLLLHLPLALSIPLAILWTISFAFTTFYIALGIEEDD